MIVGLCGFIGSGKDTVADYLVNFHNYRRESFAGSLKDAVSAVFGWDRQLLEGRSRESREWREQVDMWWAERLGIPHLSPRWVLQQWGTEVCRRNFHSDIWVASVESKLRNTHDDVVITDCRFPNEITAIRNSGGAVFWIKRGPLPEWYDVAVKTTRGEIETMNFRSDVHPSEWSWLGTEFDGEIDNNGPISDLYDNVSHLVVRK
jgi:hypothetical protein